MRPPSVERFSTTSMFPKSSREPTRPSQKASRVPMGVPPLERSREWGTVATTAGIRKLAYPSRPARKGTLVSVIGGFLRSFDDGTGDRSAYPGRANGW